MSFIYLSLLLISVTLLSLIDSIRPKNSELGVYELERRAKSGDVESERELRRENLLVDVVSLQRLAVALLLVISVVISVSWLGWLFGTALAVLISLQYNKLGQLGFVTNLSNKYYDRYEARLLDFLERYSKLLRIVRVSIPEPTTVKLHSREELAHLVEDSGGLLTVDEKKLITNGLGASSRRVSDIMTPRSVVNSIDSKEHLGPLVLDDLHKTGNSRFPVIDKDIDHVVGILHIRDMLEIDSRRKSTSVANVMDKRVFYIKEDQTVEHALAAFLRTHYHLFIVINEFRETVGIVTLEDVIEAILGRKINDEFDQHSDLRSVAARNPRKNNHTESSTDV